MSIIYSISRESGSGGGETARHLHEVLGIPFYDRSVIGKELVKQGFPVSFMDIADNLEANIFRFEAVVKDTRFHGMTPQEITAQLEKDVICAIAEESDCIILDRCAKEILEDMPHQVVSIFITASYEYRLKQIMRLHNLNEKKAADFMKKSDARRKLFFEYHTGKDWAAPSSYDVCLNIETMGMERICGLLAEGYQKFGG